uniref:THAP-type domain-containing protein n=1 Tax=Graphocephala atropunctata TaxID=36148 RepID=A0A1B6M3Z8_9HEMI
MKCAVLNCLNSTGRCGRNPDLVSFHGFPTDEVTFHEWVAATGRTHFLPTIRSKICSVHFESDAYISGRKLKPNAVPTLFPTVGFKNTQGLKPMNTIATQKITNFQAYFLKPNTSNIELVEECQNEEGSISSVPYQPQQTNWCSTSKEIQDEAVILNYNWNTSVTNSECLLPVKSVQMKTIVPTANSVTTSHSLPHLVTQSSSIISQPHVAPIKLVDMNKLLKKPPVEEWTINKPCKLGVSPKKREEVKPSYSTVKTISNPKSKTSNIKIPTNKNTPEDSSSVTVSHVIDCLKVIMPGNFGFARLIPNEKVAALVIRYLKLDDNDISRNVIKHNLKIIIDAAKSKEKFSSTINHPYLKLQDSEIQLGLTKILPTKFSMIDVSNELLNCLCIVLKVDVFSDGYHILRGMIRKFTTEGQKFSEIVGEAHTFSRKPTNKEQSKASKSKINRRAKNHSKYNETKTENSIAPIVKENSKTIENKVEYHDQIDDDDDDGNDVDIEDNLEKDPTYEQDLPVKKTKEKVSNEQPVKNKPKSLVDLEAVVKFIEERKTSAGNVLDNFKLLFYICRDLKQNHQNGPRLIHIKAALNFIKDNNIDSSNVKLFKNFSPDKQLNHSQISHLYHCKKLTMKPVVLLHNLADYRMKDLLFMREHKKFHKSNGYYSECVPTSLQQTIADENYSSDHVRNLTSESYKLFRRIITKKVGGRTKFGLKYAKLKPGSIVFAKDFAQLHLGWVKGTVIRMEGPRRYVVQFHNGEMWWCTPEQLRPFPTSLIRPRRPVKPTRLLDL